MKNIITILASLLVLSLPCLALADIDLSGMSYDELVALKDQINLAMWQCAEWQEVTVPQGLWVVGEDIPAGHWTIKHSDASSSYIKVSDTLEETGKEVSYQGDYYFSESVYNPSGSFFDPSSNLTEFDIELKDGLYVQVEYGNVIFTPYAGKASLGFSGFGSSSSVTTPAPSEAPVDPNGYAAFDYDTVSRNPDSYIGEKFTIKGEIIQVLGNSTSGYTYRLATAKYSNDVVLLYAPSSSLPDYRILEDDRVIVKCEFDGEYTYETVLGSEMTVPKATVHSIVLDESK